MTVVKAADKLAPKARAEKPSVDKQRHTAHNFARVAHNGFAAMAKHVCNKCANSHPAHGAVTLMGRTHVRWKRVRVLAMPLFDGKPVEVALCDQDVPIMHDKGKTVRTNAASSRACINVAHCNGFAVNDSGEPFDTLQALSNPPPGKAAFSHINVKKCARVVEAVLAG